MIGPTPPPATQVSSSQQAASNVHAPTHVASMHTPAEQCPATAIVTAGRGQNACPGVPYSRWQRRGGSLPPNRAPPQAREKPDCGLRRGAFKPGQLAGWGRAFSPTNGFLCIADEGALARKQLPPLQHTCWQRSPCLCAHARVWPCRPSLAAQAGRVCRHLRSVFTATYDPGHL